MSIREGQPPDSLSAAAKKIKRGFGRQRPLPRRKTAWDFGRCIRALRSAITAPPLARKPPKQDRIIMTLQLNSRTDFTIENYARRPGTARP